MQDITTDILFMILSVSWLSSAYGPQIVLGKTAAEPDIVPKSTADIALAVIMLSILVYSWGFGGTINVPIGKIGANILSLGTAVLMVTASVLSFKKRFSLSSQTDLTPQ
jgi:hypothetical protein